MARNNISNNFIPARQLTRSEFHEKFFDHAPYETTAVIDCPHCSLRVAMQIGQSSKYEEPDIRTTTPRALPLDVLRGLIGRLTNERQGAWLSGFINKLTKFVETESRGV